MNFARERIVAAGDLDEVAQFAFQGLRLIAQYLHLALDERNRGGTAIVRKSKLGEQRGVALEKIGIVLQILYDRCFVFDICIEAASRCFIHASPSVSCNL